MTFMDIEELKQELVRIESSIKTIPEITLSI